MAERNPPTPLKNQPDSKRPRTPNIVGAARNLSLTSESKKWEIRGIELVPLEKFDGNQIPTNAEVLRRLFFLREKSSKKPFKDIAEIVFWELEEICGRALAIDKPIKQAKNAIKIMHDLYENFRTFYKLRGRTLSSNEKLFIDNLNKMCDIVSADAEEQIMSDNNRTAYTRTVDINFLKGKFFDNLKLTLIFSTLTEFHLLFFKIRETKEGCILILK